MNQKLEFLKKLRNMKSASTPVLNFIKSATEPKKY